MIILEKEQVQSHQGKFICEYGQSGTGKTVTTLQSAPDPLLWLTFEPRDFDKSVKAADRPDIDFTLGVYEDFMDFIDFISNPKNFERYKTIFCDGLSYLHNIVMPSEIQEEEFDIKEQKKILAMTKVTQPQQGERNQAIFRILRLLGKNAVARGKIVIISCLEQERPKYDQELTAGPALGGREVPNNFPGFFDLIGRLTPNIDEQGYLHYPPKISFESSGGFLAKYTGKSGKKEGVLNWTKILGSIDGKKTNEKANEKAQGAKK